MFSVAYVVLPFADAAPADVIRASLALFQRGGRGEVPESWLAFRDETDAARRAQEMPFTFINHDRRQGGLQIEADGDGHFYLDIAKVRDEMRRLAMERWDVRFADTMDLDAFVTRFCNRLERHPMTGGYGRWVNPLGRWDWWDLGGRSDGQIIGDPNRGMGRSVALLSSGSNQGRAILANLQDQLEEALGQAPVAELDVLSNRNVELVTTPAGGRTGWPGERLSGGARPAAGRGRGRRALGWTPGRSPAR